MTGPAWEDPRRVLGRHGLSPKRRFSQNFLVSKDVVERIAAAVAPGPGEQVLELGPGVGTLTGALLRAGARVVAIERERDMVRVLEAELGAFADLRILEGDATTVDYAALAADARGPLVVTGNLPYAVTGAILRRLVEGRAHVGRAVLMVQREVGDRLRAPAGGRARGALSVFVQAAFAVAPVLDVPPGAFHPKPAVRSSVVRLSRHETPRAVETETFRRVVKGAFAARRKKLRNALLQAFEDDSGRVDRALRIARVDGGRRGETLEVEELAAIAQALEASAQGAS